MNEFRIITPSDDGDVRIGKKTYYSASFSTLEKAREAEDKWQKTSPTFVQQLIEREDGSKTWESID